MDHPPHFNPTFAPAGKSSPYFPLRSLRDQPPCARPRLIQYVQYPTHF